MSATHERRQSGRRALRAVHVHFITIDAAVEQLWPFRERHRKHSVWKAHWWQSVWCSVIRAALECVLLLDGFVSGLFRELTMATCIIFTDSTH